MVMGLSDKRSRRGDSCAACGRSMMLVTGVIKREAYLTKTRGCYQCRACARLTCYDCSDSREPCQCGEKQWFERAYFK
jgi:hypothetical protein